MAKRHRYKYFEIRFSFVCAFPDGLRWEVNSIPGSLDTPDKLATEMEKYLAELREMIAVRGGR